VNALGIDAGGSSSKWAVVDGAGDVLKAGRVGTLSGHLYSDDSRERAKVVLETLRSSVAQFAPRVALAGVTGLTKASPEAVWLEGTMTEVLSLERCAVIGDMDLAYRAHFQPGEGIVLYAGTGSIAYHVTEQLEVKRAGGRGYMIDDASGGYWIGQRALRFIVRQMDAGLSTDDPLSSAVLGQIGSSDWDRVRAYVYSGDRSAVSRLAPLVGMAAQQGSAEAQRILERAGRELADVAQRLQAQVGALPVTSAGGAWLVSPMIAVAARASGLAFAPSKADIAVAAARLALELS
jgi:glucosamine kinase